MQKLEFEKFLGKFSVMRSHEWIDRRSLAFDQAIAQKIEHDPHLLFKAKGVLDTWIQNRGSTPNPAWLEWREILSTENHKDILDVLIGFNERSRRLRQSSPFCGILTTEERLTILRDYESQRA